MNVVIGQSEGNKKKLFVRVPVCSIFISLPHCIITKRPASCFVRKSGNFDSTSSRQIILNLKYISNRSIQVLGRDIN